MFTLIESPKMIIAPECRHTFKCPGRIIHLHKRHIDKTVYKRIYLRLSCSIRDICADFSECLHFLPPNIDRNTLLSPKLKLAKYEKDSQITRLSRNPRTSGT